ncbi:MAG: hypothetical protein VSS52_009970, partial [Thiotrichaceae bacterium]|nr:hypothetical protein [Thiotrichaceae bacterium]
MAFRKNDLLAAAIGGILGVGAVSAYAEVNLFGDSNLPIPFPLEIEADDANRANFSLPDHALTLERRVGVGQDKNAAPASPPPNANDKFLYFRLQLPETFKFETVPNDVTVTGFAGITSIDSTGGGKGESFIQYKLELSDVSAVTPSDIVQFSFAPGNIHFYGSSRSNVTLTYQVAPETPVYNNVKDQSVDRFFEFESAYDFVSSAGGQAEATADVESSFTEFLLKDGATAASIASFQFTPVEGVSALNSGTNKTTDNSTGPVTLSHIFSSDTALEVLATDFFNIVKDSPTADTFDQAPTKVFISDNEDCSTNDLNADEVEADKAIFDNFTSNYGGTDDIAWVCVTPTGGIPIPTVDEVSLTLKLVGIERNDDDKDFTNSYISNDVQLDAVGRVIQNGTVLLSPYFTIAPKYVSRVALVNNGGRAVKYSIEAIAADGFNIDSTGLDDREIAAGTTELVVISDSKNPDNSLIKDVKVDGLSSQPGALKFVFEGGNNDIQGVYQTYNSQSGDVQSIIMHRPGGG